MESQDLSWISDDLADFGKEIRRIRTEKDQDLVIGISGDEGQGKSTFSKALGWAIDPKFALDRNVLYSPDREKTEEKIPKVASHSSAHSLEEVAERVLNKEEVKQNAKIKKLELRRINFVEEIVKIKNKESNLSRDERDLIMKYFGMKGE